MRERADAFFEAEDGFSVFDRLLQGAIDRTATRLLINGLMGNPCLRGRFAAQRIGSECEDGSHGQGTRRRPSLRNPAAVSDAERLPEWRGDIVWANETSSPHAG